MIQRTPTRFEPLGPIEAFVAWNTGEEYSLPYRDLRFYCPCAGCVDEVTGKRILKREQIREDIQVTDAQTVGRYALQLRWNDGHQTGMFHFDRLHELCEKFGRKLKGD